MVGGAQDCKKHKVFCIFGRTLPKTQGFWQVSAKSAKNLMFFAFVLQPEASSYGPAGVRLPKKCQKHKVFCTLGRKLPET